MGNQQLLLLVLATVVVGLATVAGIKAFDDNRRQLDRDSRRQVAVRILTDFKAQFNKPSELGGISFYQGEPGYWDKDKNIHEVLNQMGYDTITKDGRPSVPVGDTGGWCQIYVDSERTNADNRVTALCKDRSGEFDGRVNGVYYAGRNEIEFW